MSITFYRPRYELNLMEYEFKDLPADIDYCCLQLSNNLGGYLDIGSIVYRRKVECAKTSKGGRRGWYLGDSQSFCSNRLKFLINLIRHLKDRVQMGISAKSVFGEAWNVSRFVRWCDVEFPFAFETSEQLCMGYSNYIKYLNERIGDRTLRVLSAVSYQNLLIQTFLSVLPSKYFYKIVEVPKIYISASPPKVIIPITDVEAKECSRLYSDIFLQLSHFILEKQEFPFQMKLQHGRFSVFPNPSVKFVSANSGECGTASNRSKSRLWSSP